MAERKMTDTMQERWWLGENYYTSLVAMALRDDGTYREQFDDIE